MVMVVAGRYTMSKPLVKRERVAQSRGEWGVSMNP